MITTILLIVALICFVLAAIGVDARRVNLIALGLAFWVLSALVGSL